MLLVQKPKKSYLIESEFSFLLACLNREDLFPQQYSSDIQTSNEFDWPYFLRLARFHKVVPLIYQRLKNAGANQVPSYVLSTLRQQSCAIALKNTFHIQELIQVLDMFARYQIPVIPFKGPTLTQMVYGNMGMRPFCDLDLWVRKQDFDTSLKLLIDAGYQSPYLRQTWRRSKFFKWINSFHCGVMAHELPLGRKQQERHLFIDLHRQISKYFQISFDEILRRSKPITLQGNTVMSLGAEDSLLIMCVHGSQDGWNKLQSICDVAFILKSHPQLNINEVVFRSKEAYCTRRLLLGLSLTAKFFEIHLPAEVHQLISQDRGVLLLINDVLTRLAQQPGQDRTWQGKLQVLFMKLGMLERFVDRSKFLLNFVWSFFIAKCHQITKPDHADSKVV